jgi:hypothetical protein
MQKHIYDFTVQQRIGEFVDHPASSATTLTSAASSAHAPVPAQPPSFLPQSTTALDVCTRSPPSQQITAFFAPSSTAAVQSQLFFADSQKRNSSTGDRAFCTYQNGYALWCGTLTRKQLVDVRELQRTCDYECLDPDGCTAYPEIVEIDYAPLNADLAQHFRVVSEDEREVELFVRAKIVRNTLDFPKAVTSTVNKKSFMEAKREAVDSKKFKAKVRASSIRGKVFDDKERGIALKDEGNGKKTAAPPLRATDFAALYDGLL